jgi:hypothetical protein
MKKLDKETKIKIDCAMAYFTGWRIDNSFPDKGKVWRRDKNVELETTFKFSTDWNMLMEALSEFSNWTGYGFNLTPKNFSIIYSDGVVGSKHECENLHEQVYTCLGDALLLYLDEQARKAYKADESAAKGI